LSGVEAFVADLSLIPGEVTGLITDRVFHGASRVLTLVASHYPTLDFGVVSGRATPPGGPLTSSVNSDRAWSQSRWR
jgi:hypothetical protein